MGGGEREDGRVIHDDDDEHPVFCGFRHHAASYSLMQTCGAWTGA